MVSTYYTVIGAGGWKYDEVLAWQEVLANAISEPLKSWATKTSKQSLDAHTRQFLFILTYPLWQPKHSRPNNTETKKCLDSVFYPQKLTNATPYNNLWLRFPDLAPTFPWRQLTTSNTYKRHTDVSFTLQCRVFYKPLLQGIRHKISGAKSNQLKAMGVEMNPLIAELNKGTKTNKKEDALLAAILGSDRRAVGFRAYTSTEDFISRQGSLLEEREKQRKAAAATAGIEYQPESYFTALQAVKNAEWSHLTDKEKNQWRKYAKDNPKREEISP
jgi:hypothetical protein